MSLSADQPHLLWIDDELSAADVELRFLEVQGFRVDWAVTGSDGLAKARAGSYDGILLDLNLPDLPGLSVLATLRSENITTPVLVVTGFGDFESARVAGRLGANEFKAKPIFVDELEMAVRRLVKGQSPHKSGSLGTDGADDEVRARLGSLARLLELLHVLSRRELQPDAKVAPSGLGTKQILVETLIRTMANPTVPSTVFLACASALRRIVASGEQSMREGALETEGLIHEALSRTAAQDSPEVPRSGTPNLPPKIGTMRTISLLALSILLALEQSAAQTNRQALMLGHAVDEYLSEVYTAKSRTGFVFFSGEPIAFRVSIGNISSSRPTLVVGSTDPQQLFQVERFFASASSREASPGSRFKYADEREVNVPILFSTPKKIWAGGSFDLRLERDTPLDPGETIEWTLTVPSMNLEAGLYRFVIRMNATDSAQRPVDGFTSFAFEVRPASAEHQPEILRREVRRRFVLNDKDGARAAAVDLLRVHPNSYIAESLLAEIIDNATEAAVHRQNAQGILKSGRDALLVKYLSKEQIQQLLQPSGLVE